MRCEPNVSVGTRPFFELAIKPLDGGRLIGWTSACGMRKAQICTRRSFARVRSDLLEVPTGSPPVIRLPNRQAANEKFEARFFSWSITTE
jgi:hypothetical protein